MPVSHIEHFLVAADDIDATRDWYAQILGLSPGPHPEFGFPVHWMYMGDVDLVHIGPSARGANENQRKYLGRTSQDAGAGTGAIDHIAFRTTGLRDMLAHLRAHGGDMSSLRTLVCGGSALPESVMRAYADEFGISMTHAWGMTELSPLGSVAREPVSVTGEAVWPYRASQGRLICGVEGRLTGDDGQVLPSDGKAVGELECRGPWITASYYLDNAPEKFHDGWLRTGDVGTLDAEGFIRLTDRAKDVIKSGGEWISSMELENLIMAHPAVAEAAVIGVPDDRWGERPLAAVVLRPDAGPVTPSELRAYLGERIPRWQLPERWSFIDEVPKTSVGKFKKTTLREQYAAGSLEITTLGTSPH